MRGVPAAGGESESCCSSSGAPESPGAPAGQSHRAGREEVVRARRRLLDSPPRRPPGFPGAPGPALAARQLRWPGHFVSTSSCFTSIQLLPRPGAPQPHLQDAGLAPAPGAQRAPRLLSLASPASWSPGRPAPRGRSGPPRMPVAHLEDQRRVLSVLPETARATASRGVGRGAARNADQVVQGASR